MLAQSLLEYGAISVLAEAFGNVWFGLRDWASTASPLWLIVPVLLYFLWKRR